jgi:hypothetical protein
MPIGREKDGMERSRYATGIFSSRKLERATYDSVAFRFITANEHPDHDTIATFRRRFLKEIEGLFVRVLELAHEMGMLKVGTVALDGTKIHVNASRHSALSYEHAGKIEEQLKAEVSELMVRAEAADQADVADGMSIPDELARREERLAKLAEARAKIEARAKERFEREAAEHRAKLAARGNPYAFPCGTDFLARHLICELQPLRRQQRNHRCRPRYFCALGVCFDLPDSRAESAVHGPHDDFQRATTQRACAPEPLSP